MFSNFKHTVKTAVLCASAFALVVNLLAPIAPAKVDAAGSITVDLSAENQVIRGFGGINFPTWISDLSAEQRETAFGNGENQLGFSVLRIHVDENRNNWSKEVATAKRAQELGLYIFASPWNPPAEMTETFTRNGQANQKRLRYDKYAAYAQHLNDFVSYMKENGVELYAISVQNEPDYATEWTWWTSAEMINFLTNYASAIDCRIMAPESFQYRKEMSDPILNDSKALANTDIFGAHLYGTSYKDFAYPLFKQKGQGKELWMTEVYYPNSDANSSDKWPEAIDVAYHIGNAMVEADFQAYVWWYIRRQYGPMNENGTISKRGWCMAQYSKFVRPGFIRVDATKAPDANVYVSAYKSDDQVVMVVVNKNTSAYNYNVSINDAAITEMESWRTTGSENCKKAESYAVNGGVFTASIPAQSVTTFVGSLSAPEPDEDGAYFHSTFEAGTDGWVARGGAAITSSSDAAYVDSKALFISGRTSAWNGAAYSIGSGTFKPGQEFSFSAIVRQDSGSPVDMKLSLQYTDSSGETQYAHIDEKTAKSGSWIQLADTNFKIPEGASKMQLYIETSEDLTDFYIDEVIGALPGTVYEFESDDPPGIRGDINGDGIINIIDVNCVMLGLLNDFTDKTMEKAADLIPDGKIDASDVAVAKVLVLRGPSAK